MRGEKQDTERKRKSSIAIVEEQEESVDHLVPWGVMYLPWLTVRLGYVWFFLAAGDTFGGIQWNELVCRFNKNKNEKSLQDSF